MAISTESIIHYTDTFQKLSSILEEGFRIKYCSEILTLGDGYGQSSRAAHPMISFCDIPLSDSKQHFDAYGKYGIGLSKKWAVANGVNPVVYVDKKSIFAITLSKLLQDRREAKTNLTAEQKEYILEIKSYAKNYSGVLKRKNINTSNYKFYDEREWRLVPLKENINNASVSIALTDYNNNKDKYNNKLADCRFKFSPNDISYIIVEKTNEIPQMLRLIRDIYGSRCTSNELDILFSKICSTEQIIADF